LLLTSPTSGLFGIFRPPPKGCTGPCKEMQRALSSLEHQITNLDRNSQKTEENWVMVNTEITKNKNNIEVLSENQMIISSDLKSNGRAIRSLTSKVERIDLVPIVTRIDRLVDDLDEIKSKPGTLDPYLTARIDEQRRDINNLMTNVYKLKGQLSTMGVDYQSSIPDIKTYMNDEEGLVSIGGSKAASFRKVKQRNGKKQGKEDDLEKRKSIFGNSLLNKKGKTIKRRGPGAASGEK